MKVNKKKKQRGEKNSKKYNVFITLVFERTNKSDTIYEK